MKSSKNFASAAVDNATKTGGKKRPYMAPLVVGEDEFETAVVAVSRCTGTHYNSYEDCTNHLGTCAP